MLRINSHAPPTLYSEEAARAKRANQLSEFDHFEWVGPHLNNSSDYWELLEHRRGSKNYQGAVTKSKQLTVVANKSLPYF